MEDKIDIRQCIQTKCRYVLSNADFLLQIKRPNSCQATFTSTFCKELFKCHLSCWFFQMILHKFEAIMKYTLIQTTATEITRSVIDNILMHLNSETHMKLFQS